MVLAYQECHRFANCLEESEKSRLALKKAARDYMEAQGLPKTSVAYEQIRRKLYELL